jgi:hypothetical protein
MMNCLVDVCHSTYSVEKRYDSMQYIVIILSDCQKTVLRHCACQSLLTIESNMCHIEHRQLMSMIRCDRLLLNLHSRLSIDRVDRWRFYLSLRTTVKQWANVSIWIWKHKHIKQYLSIIKRVQNPMLSIMNEWMVHTIIDLTYVYNEHQRRIKIECNIYWTVCSSIDWWQSSIWSIDMYVFDSNLCLRMLQSNQSKNLHDFCCSTVLSCQ